QRIPPRAHPARARPVPSAPTGRVLPPAGAYQTVRLWDLTENPPKELALVKAHPGEVLAVAYAPDSKTFATAAGNTVKQWSVNGPIVKEKEKPLPPGHESAVLSLAISPDGKVAATGGQDNTVRLWDIRSAKPVHRIALEEPRAVPAVALTPNGKTLAHSSGPSNLKVWDLIGDKP